MTIKPDNLLLSDAIFATITHHVSILLFRNDKLILLVAKIVEDLLITCEISEVAKFISGFNAHVKIGTFSHGPDHLRFYGLNVE